jgi:hypothetical protein
MLTQSTLHISASINSINHGLKILRKTFVCIDMYRVFSYDLLDNDVQQQFPQHLLHIRYYKYLESI